MLKRSSDTTWHDTQLVHTHCARFVEFHFQKPWHIFKHIHILDMKFAYKYTHLGAFGMALHPFSPAPIRTHSLLRCLSGQNAV